ncbi:MAG: hypothetical protein NVS1B13_20410 [Flavisolibacter sp.]
MKEYIIDVSNIEDFQTTKNLIELYKIFTKAKSTIVNGEKVVLVRKNREGMADRFDQFTNLDDLDQFRRSVFKYL